jgi:hypothetical protein
MVKSGIIVIEHIYKACQFTVLPSHPQPHTILIMPAITTLLSDPYLLSHVGCFDHLTVLPNK